MEANEAVNENQDYALRFEDLTVDDDLPLLDRIVRYCRSGIALQRLVHVKMLAESAETVGTSATLTTLVPLLSPLVSDPESVIRQHLASQILPICIVSMATNVGIGKRFKVSDVIENPTLPKDIDTEGYNVVTSTVVSHLNTLITDADVDVRRSASDSLAGLALHFKKQDVASCILPIPLQLAKIQPPKSGKKSNDQENMHEELRITAANLLAELGGASEKGAIPADLVSDSVIPTVLSLCEDPGFRVRRAAAQALPRVLGGTSIDDARTKIIPAFTKLSKDEVYRVRKSTGECLVDMSRSLMIVAGRVGETTNACELRRTTLIPIAEALLADANKFVRHGMMQFLGPFLASFYPFVDSPLTSILPGTSESDGSNHCGIVAQFFPHASSMVSRLNSSAAATTSSPIPSLANPNISEPTPSEIERLYQALPAFILANRSSMLSLKAVVAHRRAYPPNPDDLKAVMDKLLDHFVGLAKVNTGDDNTDAEMRVYCAYSYPAVVLLLGSENWEGRLKECFGALLNPSQGAFSENNEVVPPPLPVKRCLASSLHTVAHILGSEISSVDVMPIFRSHFLRDTDESVRLNMIRNFPTVLSLLQPTLRSQYLLQWCETIRGEEVLGAMRRSATNPLVLNWRQRDYVSRCLPDLMGMVDAAFVHAHLWPILKLLLTDTINIVREDAIWSIPTLLKAFCPDNVVIENDKNNRDSRERWSAVVCQEVVLWLKDAILCNSSSRVVQKGNTVGKGPNFSQRQLYCRICATLALAVRFGKGLEDPNDPASQLKTKVQQLLAGSDVPTWGISNGPFQKMTEAELFHLKRILLNDLLPVAIDFKDDHVTNVRLTLMKALHVMPKEMSQLSGFNEAVRLLEEEVETWESFNVTPSDPQAANAKAAAPGTKAGTAPTSSNDMSRAENDSEHTREQHDGQVRSRSSEKSGDKSQKKKTNPKKKKPGHENMQAQGNSPAVDLADQGEMSMATI